MKRINANTKKTPVEKKKYEVMESDKERKTEKSSCVPCYLYIGVKFKVRKRQKKGAKIKIKSKPHTHSKTTKSKSEESKSNHV